MIAGKAFGMHVSGRLVSADDGPGDKSVEAKDASTKLLTLPLRL
jgi:hypothetical protein